MSLTCYHCGSGYGRDKEWTIVFFCLSMLEDPVSLAAKMDGKQRK
jgi:hypothetical protein